MPEQYIRKRSLSPQHSTDDGTSEVSNVRQGRQRSRVACAPCRSRKRKCDGCFPCSTCSRYEYHCVYNDLKQPPSARNGEPSHSQPPIEPEPAPVEPGLPSIIQLQKHPLPGGPGARFHHRSIMDPVKSRFVRANSAIAFPRVLGIDMQSDVIPRLHSFAWCVH